MASRTTTRCAANRCGRRVAEHGTARPRRRPRRVRTIPVREPQRLTCPGAKRLRTCTILPGLGAGASRLAARLHARSGASVAPTPTACAAGPLLRAQASGRETQHRRIALAGSAPDARSPSHDGIEDPGSGPDLARAAAAAARSARDHHAHDRAAARQRQPPGAFTGPALAGTARGARCGAASNRCFSGSCGACWWRMTPGRSRRVHRARRGVRLAG